MGIFLAFLIGGVIIFLILLSNVQKSNKLKSEGKIIDRKAGFWEEKQIFELDAPYEEVLEAVKRTDYTGCAVEIQFNFGGKKDIFYKSGHAWNAELKYLGFSDMKHRYSLSFTAWKNRRNAPYDVFSMNIFLTQTEKMLLSLDPETIVETHGMEIKTKTNFI